MLSDVLAAAFMPMRLFLIGFKQGARLEGSGRSLRPEWPEIEVEDRGGVVFLGKGAASPFPPVESLGSAVSSQSVVQGEAPAEIF